VEIEYHRREAQVHLRLGDDWRVCPSDELLQNLGEYYGDQNVALIYGQ